MSADPEVTRTETTDEEGQQQAETPADTSGDGGDKSE